MSKKDKIPRQYSLVKLHDWYVKWGREQGNDPSYVFFEGETIFVFLGEIPNMRGHCVVVGRKSGKIFTGFHIENFVELTEDET